MNREVCLKEALYRAILFTIACFTVLVVRCSFKEDSLLFKGAYSEQYIMRWAFQSLCSYSFDPRVDPFVWPTSSRGVRFNPKLVQGGEVIFVRNVDLFFKTLYKQIEHPFIMVTAGEARDKVEERHLAFLDNEKIIAWFSVHPHSLSHPKFHALPLGIYQDKKYYYQREKLTQRFAALRATPKKKMLYVNFGDVKGGKPERARAKKILKCNSFCYTAKKRLPFLAYMEEMAQFKFTVSPPGYGPDCYRTWEALLVGSIPIVKTSHLDPLFEGLPVLIVHDWTDITKQFLEQAYERILSQKYSIEPLFIDYWAQKIEQIRSNFLAKKEREGL